MGHATGNSPVGVDTTVDLPISTVLDPLRQLTQPLIVQEVVG